MALLSIPTKQSPVEGLTPAERAKLNEENTKRENALKTKIKAVARVNRMFQTVRNERETLTELMNVMGTKSVPAKYLILSGDDLRAAIATFDVAKRSDAPNEMIPDEAEISDTASIYSMVTEGETKFFEPMEVDTGLNSQSTAPLPVSKDSKSNQTQHAK